MAQPESLVAASAKAGRQLYLLLFMLGVGAVLRLHLAVQSFLNPDEALHYFVATQPSFVAAYKASLTMAHPPLMVLLLHGWSAMGSSEFFLRLPFVAAGLLFAWTMFLWVRQIAGDTAGCLALGLALFLPSLVSLSAEIRQYSLLLFFCAACLYWLELGLDKSSGAWMAASFAALYLALLTHYSAMIFAAAVALYGLLRLYQARVNFRVKAAWIAGQLFALGICAFLFESQVVPLRHRGTPSEIAATWLRDSIFQPAQDHILPFIFSKSLRLFRYFFSHGAIGVLGLLFFAYGIWTLIRAGNARRNPALALLLTLPFLITLAAAMAGIYPYGGTRHDALLVVFAIAGIAIGLDGLNLQALRIQWRGAKASLLALGLLICNLFPSPSGPAIRPHNQRREVMLAAKAFLQSHFASSTILTDYQSGLVLSYYLCGKRTGLPFGQSSDQLFRWQCGEHLVLTSLRSEQRLDVPTLPSIIQQARNSVPQEQTLLLFQTGWIEDKARDQAEALRPSGCTGLRNFGANIRICRIN